jgi:uncharacterized protein (DUF58 family)
MTPPPSEPAPLLSLADITEIELIILRRMREFTMGDHRSRQQGSGFDFIGLRDWQPGDRFESIDWAQSSMTNFSPLVVRQFEQPSTATVAVIADASLSTRCGMGGVSIGTNIARAVATIGLSAVFFQDLFGLVTFDSGFEHLGAIRPRTGRGHVVHCIEAYQNRQGLQPVKRTGDLSNTIGGYFRSAAMLPVVSDFLFDDAPHVLRELSLLNATHDVFLIMVDSAFAFELPAVSAGWVQVLDIESGKTRTISRREYLELGDRVREWQSSVQAIAKDLDLDVVRLGLDQAKSDIALSEFVGERRLRKVYA